MTVWALWFQPPGFMLALWKIALPNDIHKKKIPQLSDFMVSVTEFCCLVPVVGLWICGLDVLLISVSLTDWVHYNNASALCKGHRTNKYCLGAVPGANNEPSGCCFSGCAECRRSENCLVGLLTPLVYTFLAAPGFLRLLPAHDEGTVARETWSRTHNARVTKPDSRSGGDLECDDDRQCQTKANCLCVCFHSTPGGDS